jgi:cytochrome c-type biogenesis protein CcmF
MTFENEHLIAGQVGQFFIVLAFVASIVSAISYFTASKIDLEIEKNKWIKLGRGAFFIEALSLIAVFAGIFYICSNHYFEYFYAYKHD